MILILTIDVLAIGVLLTLALSRGLEQTLPFVAFVFTLIPREATIPFFGLFDLTTQRLILVVLMFLYIVLPRRAGGISQVSTPLKWLIFIHICWCLISTANSIVPVDSIKKMVGEVAEYYFLYLVFFRTISDARTVYRILFGITAAMIACSCFGVVEAYSDWTLLQWFPAASYRFEGWGAGEALERVGRIESSFPHPILYGAGLVMGITLALYLLTIKQRTSKRVFLWVGLSLMFLNLYKTSSRGPWIAAIMSCGLLLLFVRNNLRRYALVVAALAVLVLVMRPGVWETIANIYDGTTNPDSPLGSSYEYRYALRKVAANALSRSADRTIWGYGMESFYDLHLQGELNGRTYPFLSCDSAWIEMTVETGYVGLLIISSLLLTPLWSTWKDFRLLPRPERYLSFTMLVNMFAFYLMMLSVAMYGWGQNGYMLWMLIATSLAFGTLTRAELVRKVPAVGVIDNDRSLSSPNCTRPDSLVGKLRATLSDNLSLDHGC